MLYSASTNNNHVLTIVIGLVEVDYHISIDMIDVVNISQDWLSHHMITENVVIDVLH
jgi:hypothetical protein